jgi:DNA polymerase-3 subunit epsilon
MSRTLEDGCGCFPTGRHYPGIAHLLQVTIRGLAQGLAQDAPWHELNVALLDVETTGRDASVDRVVELGIVIGRGGEIVARHNWLIHPGMPIPAEVSAIHGITDEMVKDKPRFDAVASEVLDALRGAIPAAYNAPFDRAFLMSEVGRAKVDVAGVPAVAREVEWLDPLVWARELQHDEKSRALGDVAARLGVKLEQAHRASDDAEAALRVMYALGKDPRVPRSYGAMIQEQRRLAQAQADQRRMWRS